MSFQYQVVHLLDQPDGNIREKGSLNQIWACFVYYFNIINTFVLNK